MKYVAQGIPQIDAEIAEKGRFWMETSQSSQLTVKGLRTFSTSWVFITREPKFHVFRGLLAYGFNMFLPFVFPLTIHSDVLMLFLKTQPNEVGLPCTPHPISKS